MIVKYVFFLGVVFQLGLVPSLRMMSDQGCCERCNVTSDYVSPCLLPLGLWVAPPHVDWSRENEIVSQSEGPLSENATIAKLLGLFKDVPSFFIHHESWNATRGMFAALVRKAGKQHGHGARSLSFLPSSQAISRPSEASESLGGTYMCMRLRELISWLIVGKPKPGLLAQISWVHSKPCRSVL